MILLLINNIKNALRNCTNRCKNSIIIELKNNTKQIKKWQNQDLITIYIPHMRVAPKKY